MEICETTERREFLHELRNPLAAIRGYAQLIQMQLQNPGPHTEKTRLQRLLQRIDEAASRADKLAHSYVENFSGTPTSQLMGGKELCELIEASLELHREKCKSLGIELLFESPPNDGVFEIYPLEMGQILDNLLNNAREVLTKENHQGRKWIGVHVSLLNCLQDTEKQELFVAVIDSGPGLPAGLENLLICAMPTSKLDTSAHGHGLRVASQKTKLHGSELGYKRSKGSSLFYFTLTSKSRQPRLAAG